MSVKQEISGARTAEKVYQRILNTPFDPQSDPGGTENKEKEENVLREKLTKKQLQTKKNVV